MRTNDERITALHTRASQLNKEKRNRQALIIGSACVAMCLVAVIALAFAMPGFSDAFIADAETGTMSGSIFSNSRILGFIVIGIIAFILGSAVTIFCMRLIKWKNHNDTDQGDRL